MEKEKADFTDKRGRRPGEERGGGQNEKPHPPSLVRRESPYAGRSCYRMGAAYVRRTIIRAARIEIRYGVCTYLSTSCIASMQLQVCR